MYLSKNILKTSILAIFAVLLNLMPNSEIKAQDIEFSQFYANPLYLNPAFAGSNRCPRVGISYKNQWPGITGTYITSSASYDQQVDAINGGLGFIFTTDQAASTLKSTRISGIYSYQLKVNRKFSIRMGGEATFFQKSIDWSKLRFGDMIDDRRGFVYKTGDNQRGGNISGIDFSAGIIGFSEIFFFGVSAHHLTQPEESVIIGESPLPVKITGHAGAVIPMSGGAAKYTTNDVTLSPNIMFRSQGEFTQMNVGLYLKKGPFVAGAWYRNKDAFIILLGIQTEILNIGYSYDVTVSSLSTSSGGGHEVSLAYTMQCKPKQRTFRTLSCPSF